MGIKLWTHRNVFRLLVLTDILLFHRLYLSLGVKILQVFQICPFLMFLFFFLVFVLTFEFGTSNASTYFLQPFSV